MGGTLRKPKLGFAQLTVLVGSLLALSLASPSLTSASTTIPIEFQSADDRAVKPSRIQVGNISYLSGIRWSSWGGQSARGRGTYNACDYSGACRKFRVVLRASSRNWCRRGYLYEALMVTGSGRGLPISQSWRRYCGHGQLAP